MANILKFISIVATALPSIFQIKLPLAEWLNVIFTNWSIGHQNVSGISTIIFIFLQALIFYALYIHIIGSGIGIGVDKPESLIYVSQSITKSNKSQLKSSSLIPIFGVFNIKSKLNNSLNFIRFSSTNSSLNQLSSNEINREKDKLSSSKKVVKIDAIISYNNLHLNLNEIRNKYKDKGIIYGIQNNITKKLYIGSSVDGFIRLYAHLLRPSPDHSNIRLRNSINKNGLANFTLHICNILEFANTLTPAQKRELLLPLEQLHIDKYLPDNKDQLYNFLYEAGSTLGYKHSEETKAKISAGQIKALPNKKKRDITPKPLVINTNTKTQTIFVYDSFLNLINGNPFPSKEKIIEMLSVSGITITKYIDTNVPYIKNNTYFYFYSQQLTEAGKLILSQNNQNIVQNKKPVGIGTPVWIYRKDINGNLIPYNQDGPTFSSLLKASQVLHCARGTIVQKILDGDKQTPIKDLYFYNQKQEI